MSAAELRQAAATLRETAGNATAGPWSTVSGAANVLHFPDDDFRDPRVVVGPGRGASLADVAWIALAHPGLAEPLAAWLDTVADQYEAPKCDDPTGVCNGCEQRDDFVEAAAVARIIAGGGR